MSTKLRLWWNPGKIPEIPHFLLEPLQPPSLSLPLQEYIFGVLIDLYKYHNIINKPNIPGFHLQSYCVFIYEYYLGGYKESRLAGS